MMPDGTPPNLWPATIEDAYPQTSTAATSSYLMLETMERFWSLENSFLASLANAPASEEIADRRLLMSAVLFGALLLKADWPFWLAAVRRLKRPNNSTTKHEGPSPLSISFWPVEGGKVRLRQWLADPLTAAMFKGYGQEVSQDRGRLARRDMGNNADLMRLLLATNDAFLEELGGWVLAGARIKYSLQLPPLLVEQAVGELRAQPLPPAKWDALLNNGSFKPANAGPLQLPITMGPATAPAKEDRRYYYIKDRGFHEIRGAIDKAIEAYVIAPEPTLRLERDSLLQQLSEILSKRRKWDKNSDSFGSKVTEWFRQFCTSVPQAEQKQKEDKGSKFRFNQLRASTLLNYAFQLGGKTNWSDIWDLKIDEITNDKLEAKLHAAIELRPEAYFVAKRLFRYLERGSLALPKGMTLNRSKTTIKGNILTAAAFKDMLELLMDENGAGGAHWLAAVLMFRCGLRGREVVALSIDHVIIIGDLVELQVRATPYVDLKTKTSRRSLPLHALLEPDELACLLRWRAMRIRQYRWQKPHARMFFDTRFSRFDYKSLLEPIETAIRMVCNDEAPEEHKETAAYIFSRCSTLRHSFVSYALTSLLLPRDDGGFQLPAGITRDLVSLERRDRLEQALLAPGHLGLSAVEAIRQLVGHSNFKRTIQTYSHLLDLVIGAHCWRRSVEPSLPADVAVKLSGRKLDAAALLRPAYSLTKAERDEARASEVTLRDGGALPWLAPPRQRRERGQSRAPWEAMGNTFLSQVAITRPSQAPEHTERQWIEWRDETVQDWRAIDAILQQATRGVPVSLIADEVGVSITTCERLISRFYQLVSRRRKRGAGKLQHGLLMQRRCHDEGLPTMDGHDHCWLAPIKPIPREIDAAVDGIWAKLEMMRGCEKTRRSLRSFLKGHQDGVLILRDKARSMELTENLKTLAQSGQPAIGNARMILLGRRECGPRYEVSVYTRDKSGNQNVSSSSAAAVVIYLLILAEVTSTRPLIKGLTDTAWKHQGATKRLCSDWLTTKLRFHRARKSPNLDVALQRGEKPVRRQKRINPVSRGNPW